MGPIAPIDSSSWWFMMQVGMILGFLTSWPVNRWLLRSGIKEPMGHVGHPGASLGSAAVAKLET